MKSTDMNRRDFTRWTAAAFGGVVAGTMAGCASEQDAEAPAPGGGGSPAGDGATGTTDGEVVHDVAYLLEEPHVCRGLNTCEGKGKGGENACAGQGACANAAAHMCHYHNECKGQGGCGEHPGQNSCKQKGECAVPLSQPAWESARAAFEKAMQEAGKTVGAAPEAVAG